jgi:hypothetical protein
MLAAMNPEEIVRRLGETKTKALFQELTADAMKKVLREANLPTARAASHTSTRKRNEDWAGKVWRYVDKSAATTTAATLLFEWLTRARRPMLAEFLSALDVPHDNGLTDADFMQTSTPEKLVEVGKALLAKHDKAEVATYLLFLDASNKSEIFKALELEKHLAPSA